MKRFVTYLYEYTGAKKGKNTGFVRIDLLNEDCRIDLHIRNCKGYNGKAMMFLIMEDSGLVGVNVGEFMMNRGMGDYGTIIKKSPVMDTNYRFEQMVGVGVIYGGDQMCASKWKEDPNLTFAWRDIRVWEPPQLEEETAIPMVPELEEELDIPMEPEPEEKSVIPTEPEPEEQTDIPTEPEPEEEPAIPTEPEKEEEPDIPMEPEKEKEPVCPLQQESILKQASFEVHNVFPKEEWYEIWKDMVKNHEKIEFRPEQKGTWIKIDVKGIRELPKKHWYLGNNSFLLHGFFNYRYLILGCEEISNQYCWYLGIPGFYQQQERVMATIFGFPEFYSAKENELFGYWIHQLEG